MPLVAEVRAAVPRHQLSPLVVVAPLCWVQEPAALSFVGAVVAARVFPVAVRAVAVVVAVVVVVVAAAAVTTTVVVAVAVRVVVAVAVRVVVAVRVAFASAPLSLFATSFASLALLSPSAVAAAASPVSPAPLSRASAASALATPSLSARPPPATAFSPPPRVPDSSPGAGKTTSTRRSPPVFSAPAFSADSDFAFEASTVPTSLLGSDSFPCETGPLENPFDSSSELQSIFF